MPAKDVVYLLLIFSVKSLKVFPGSVSSEIRAIVKLVSQLPTYMNSTPTYVTVPPELHVNCYVAISLSLSLSLSLSSVIVLAAKC